MKNIELRIKRPRTEAKDSTLEILEWYAHERGRTVGQMAIRFIEQAPIFKEYAKEKRNPEKATI